MGYNLEFHQLSLESFRQALEGGAPEISVRARDVFWWEMVGPPTELTLERWNKAMAELAGTIALRPESEAVSDDAASCFVAHVHALGRSLGELNHSSGGGSDFRDQFLDEVASSCLPLPDLSLRLTNDSVFGLYRDEYPSWGALTAAEVASLRQNSNPPPPDLDEDQEGWLADLLDILENWKEGQDIVTLYL